MELEFAIDEEKVTAMTKGERTRRARAQVQEERARREEGGEESQGSESEEEGSGSSASGGVTGFQCTVFELLKGVDGNLKGMRADVQSLGTWVLVVERRMSQLEESTAARAETEAEAKTEGWGEAEETGAGGETGGEVTVAEGVMALLLWWFTRMSCGMILGRLGLDWRRLLILRCPCRRRILGPS